MAGSSPEYSKSPDADPVLVALEQDLFTPDEEWTPLQAANLRAALNAIRKAEELVNEMSDYLPSDAWVEEFADTMKDIADLYDVFDVEGLVKRQQEIDLPLPPPEPGEGGMGGYL